MMGYVMFAGWLIAVFVDLPLAFIAIIGPLLWAVGTGLSALFLAAFLEEGAQSPLMRRITMILGYWMLIVPSFCALQWHATQGWDDQLYFYSCIPAILVVMLALAEALWRGSRSARFIAVAWAPIILASIERLMRGLGVYVGPSGLDQAMYVATGLEVIVISLAIADRFLAIRRERDEALIEAQMLEQLSVRDPLTGLLNRRGLASQFDEFTHRGFDTFALIDLDRFKQVNDLYGHQVGDAALVACADALRAGNDPDMVAARLGGEEFVVLMRGPNAVQRAEALRQSIPQRILADVEGLSAPVTASMGLVEMPRRGKAMMGFNEFYARADALMYEAKASGRNRMSYERMILFGDEAQPNKAGDGRVAEGSIDARSRFARRAVRDRRSGAA
jgi:diguanylate cyclase (GGDEF)-like protein